MKWYVPVLMLGVFFGFMILVILWIRKESKRMGKGKKLSSVEKLRLLEK